MVKFPLQSLMVHKLDNKDNINVKSKKIEGVI